MKPRVAVLIVSGFLGSGKTTLVRKLLLHAQANGVRLAVISNEFGELGIDAALLGADQQRFIELAGGCVCCQLSDDLVDTLEELRNTVDPDQIVIETSGVALPFETQLNLYRPPVNQWVGDEANVVVVDARQLHDRLQDPQSGEAFAEDTFENQVSGADLLVLHKIDLVPADTLPSLEAALSVLNPGVPILHASFGEVSPAALFPEGPRRRPAVKPHHHEGFRYEELQPPADLDPDQLLEWLAPRRGIRTKGFVRTSQGIRIVQGVGRRIELQEPRDLVVPEAVVGRIVAIHYAPQHGHSH